MYTLDDMKITDITKLAKRRKQTAIIKYKTNSRETQTHLEN